MCFFLFCDFVLRIRKTTEFEKPQNPTVQTGLIMGKASKDKASKDKSSKDKAPNVLVARVALQMAIDTDDALVGVVV
jgi:hypothetical protein